MGTLIIAIIGLGTILLAVGIAIPIATMAVIGAVFLGVGILLTRLGVK